MTGGNNLLAAVDIGTNSVRLLIAKPNNRLLDTQLRALRMCRLGEGMTSGEGLQPQAVARTVQALQEFKALLETYGVHQIRTVATSAVREAPNAAFFVDHVRSQTGLAVDVIGGKEEAYLSYLGACKALPEIGGGVVIDIGGGSTEFTWPSGEKNSETLVSHSIPLGAVRLTEQPLLPPGILAGLKPALEPLQAAKPAFLIGVGGTITTLASVDQKLPVYDPERVHGYRLSRGAVERILFFLSAQTNDQRKQVAGLQPERADIIVAGTTILWTILDYLDAEQIIVSEADILDGIIHASFCPQQ